MLSSEERAERYAFYAEIFGPSQLTSICTTRDSLWPVEAYDAKIEGLRERGFTNPVKLITSMSSILGLSFENIDWKLWLCRRLHIDSKEFIAYSVIFVTMSAKNYVPIARKLRADKKEPTPKNVFAIYKAKSF